MPIVVQLLLTLLLATLPAVARAQLSTFREYERQVDSERGALSLDLNTFFGKAKGAGYSLLQPTVLGAFRYREVVLEAALPLAYFHESNEPGADRDRFALGNPWFALAYLPDCRCGLSRLSLGIAADAAQSESRLEQVALALARGAMGDWDGYLWIDRMLPLVLGASTRMELGRKARLSWHGDLVLGLPAGQRDFELGTQHALELSLLPSWHWQIAARMSGVWYPTFVGDDFQSALTLSLRHVFVTDSIGARFVMNLDSPHGFAFSRAGMWGLGVFYATRVGD